MKKMMNFIGLAFLSIAISACDDRYMTDDTFNQDYNDTWSDYDDYDEDPYTGMQDSVNDALTIDSYYENFSWHIDLKTSLETEYPDMSFRYGVEMGYGKYQWYVYMDSYGNGYYYEELPIFVNGEGSPYLDLTFYWKTYKSLLAKLERGEELSGMSPDDGERGLMSGILSMYRKKEKEAKSSFIYRVFVDVDGQRYYYGY